MRSLPRSPKLPGPVQRTAISAHGDLSALRKRGHRRRDDE